MKKMGLFIPWILVCLATIGSLFFSSVIHKEPCTLCWYQRIILYPLVIILGIAAFRKAYQIVLYVLPLSLIGLALAAYHVIMLTFYSSKNACPMSKMKGMCQYPISFPLMSLGAFLLLNILLILTYLKHKGSRKL